MALNSKQKNILVLSYFFPPCNKVGGRRWAKFTRQLTERGYNVKVICVNVPYSGACPWEKDIQNFQQKIKRLDYIEHRPFFQVNKSPSSLAGKIRYRLSWYAHKMRNSAVSPDISLKYEKPLLKEAEQLIQRDSIETIVVTGGPFYWCFHAMKLKEKFPGIRFLLDLRDFWTGGDAYEKLDQSQKSEEDKRELYCIRNADFVFTPAERIATFLKKKYNSEREKIILLPHAYDKTELPEGVKHEPESDTLKFIYGGILYSNMEKSIVQLIQFLSHLNKQHRIRLDLYTFDKKYKELFDSSEIKEQVHYHNSISPKELFGHFLKSDYLLQLRAGEAQEQHFKSTKFYELIAMRRPIIYFGPEGDVSDFIVAHKLGYNGNMKAETLAERIINNKTTREVPDTSFDVSEFEFSAVTDKLETYL